MKIYIAEVAHVDRYDSSIEKGLSFARGKENPTIKGMIYAITEVELDEVLLKP